MSDLECPKLALGIIPLVDCAPIVLAEELGAFERHGLEVEIHHEAYSAHHPGQGGARPARCGADAGADATRGRRLASTVSACRWSPP